MKTIAILSTVLVFIAACGGGGDGRSIPIDEFDTRGLEALCGYYVRCGWYPNNEACNEAFFSNQQLIADIKAGRIIYDGRAAATCLDGIATLGCNRSDSATIDPNGAEACRKALRGTLNRGEACLVNEACVSANCNRTSCGTDACCSGTCEDKIAVGGDCSSAGARCADGLACKWSTATASGVCMAPIPAGAACVKGDLCAPGTYCTTDPTTPQTVCGRLPATGAPCPDGICDSSSDTCDVATKTCVRKIAVGASCMAVNDNCVSYGRCDGTSMTCVARKRAGEPCATSADCLTGISCENGTCSARPDVPACS